MVLATAASLATAAAPQAMPGELAYYRAVASYFQVPASEVAILAHGGDIAADEIPVVLFVARRGGVSAEAVAALRESGRGWTELAQRFGVGANALHIPLRDPTSAGVLSAAYQRFAATPMRRPHYLVSYALSRLLFLVLEVGAIVGFGWLIFDVAVRGPLLAVLVVAIVGGLTFAALGLLVAARSRTIESVSGWMNLLMLPMWLLSGSFFSYERFPEAFWPAIRLLPLTAVNDALRAVFRGEALVAGALPELLVLAVWGLVSFVIAVRRFRWQ